MYLHFHGPMYINIRVKPQPIKAKPSTKLLLIIENIENVTKRTKKHLINDLKPDASLIGNSVISYRKNGI